MKKHLKSKNVTNHGPEHNIGYQDSLHKFRNSIYLFHHVKARQTRPIGLLDAIGLVLLISPCSAICDSWINMLLFCIIASYCAINQWYVIAPYCVICNSWIYRNIDSVSWQLQQWQMQNDFKLLIAWLHHMLQWIDISLWSAICYYEFKGIFL